MEGLESNVSYKPGDNVIWQPTEEQATTDSRLGFAPRLLLYFTDYEAYKSLGNSNRIGKRHHAMIEKVDENGDIMIQLTKIPNAKYTVPLKSLRLKESILNFPEFGNVHEGDVCMWQPTFDDLKTDPKLRIGFLLKIPKQTFAIIDEIFDDGTAQIHIPKTLLGYNSNLTFIVNKNNLCKMSTYSLLKDKNNLIKMASDFFSKHQVKKR
jgi:hypothetical protein